MHRLIFPLYIPGHKVIFSLIDKVFVPFSEVVTLPTGNRPNPPSSSARLILYYIIATKYFIANFFGIDALLND